MSGRFLPKQFDRVSALRCKREALLRFGNLSNIYITKGNIMYQVRTEHHSVVRTYTADTYFDAVDLFHMLSRLLGLVQIWQGDKLISEYKA